MSDIVERLRHQVRDLHGDDFTSPYEGFVSPLDAADEIERLRADNERLRSALRDIEADLREQASGSQDGYLLDVANRMRAALEVKND